MTDKVRKWFKGLIISAYSSLALGFVLLFLDIFLDISIITYDILVYLLYGMFFWVTAVTLLLFKYKTPVK